MAKVRTPTAEDTPPADLPPELPPVAAPARKAMSPGDIDELSDRLIIAHEAADKILMAVASGDELTGIQVTLLRSVGIENPFEIQRRVDQLKSILRHQEQAGTQLQREALASLVSKAEEKRDAELPEIRAELEAVVKRLQAKIDALEAAVSVPTGKLAVMNVAVENLRTVRGLPAFVQDKYNVIRGRTKALFEPLYEAESILVNRTGLLKLLSAAEPFLNTSNRIPHSSESAVMLSRHNLWADILDRRIDTGKFMALKAQCERELAAAQVIVDRDAPQRAGRLAECEQARDYYVL